MCVTVVGTGALRVAVGLVGHAVGGPARVGNTNMGGHFTVKGNVLSSCTHGVIVRVEHVTETPKVWG